jgi:hypothetical protein
LTFPRSIGKAAEVTALIIWWRIRRLRTKWATIHTDEVYFRDTAHGFLVWAVGLVVTAAFLASAATSMIGSAAIATTTASVSSVPAQADDPYAYFVDTLFRSDSPNPGRSDAQVSAETKLIYANALRQGTLPEAHRTYLAKLVAARTGVDQTAAEQWVTEVFAEIQRAAETTRKAAAIYRFGYLLPCSLARFARATPPRSEAGSAITSSLFKRFLLLPSVDVLKRIEEKLRCVQFCFSCSGYRFPSSF